MHTTSMRYNGICSVMVDINGIGCAPVEFLFKLVYNYVFEIVVFVLLGSK